MKCFRLFLCASLALIFSLQLEAEKTHKLYVVSTGDVHGSYFPEDYLTGAPKPSLMSFCAYVDSLRAKYGKENILVLDAGDFLQGDCASYYYNYVSKDPVHLYPRMAKYIGYDAVIPGNHDFETGHAVYDRVNENLRSLGVPMLCANVFTDEGEYYFTPYAIFKKAGLKVAVIGFSNPNIASWIGPELRSGLNFESLIPRAQTEVDKVREKEKPDVVVVVIHSGTGKGDGKEYENQGLDLQKSLKGVDLIICGHDHKPVKISSDNGPQLVDGGARCYSATKSLVTAVTRGKHLKYKRCNIYVDRLNKNVISKDMRMEFNSEFEEVRKFDLAELGNLEIALRSREAYIGQCPYLNLIHKVQLESTGASISFAAPLSFDGTVDAGPILYRDLFTIYPFENQLFAIDLSGAEIKSYLEYSYDRWIGPSDGHILKISKRNDARTGSEKWSFDNRHYNFDSAAGINYTVDVYAPYGSRVKITSLSDGTPFSAEAVYKVALTSYRANGGGGLLPVGVGVKATDLESRNCGKFPEIRELIYQYLKKHPILDASSINDIGVLGEWKFIPEDETASALKEDMRLIF